jgi:hypothetical protein
MLHLVEVPVKEKRTMGKEKRQTEERETNDDEKNRRRT